MTEFVDSNVILYLASADRAKVAAAERLLRRTPIISVQVMNEVARVMLGKFRATAAETRLLLDGIRGLATIVPVTMDTHDLGLSVALRYRTGVFDAMLLAAAVLAGCETFWSEDMQDGLVIGGALTVRNPFA